jgi:hypothetical protein
MRFAYIDSLGKKVAIPSVEAVQLRIELGAIVPATMFFDASADRWAPAEEHEIFRKLRREKTESEDAGFVAPPPEEAAVEPGLLDAAALFSGVVDLVETEENEPGPADLSWEPALSADLSDALALAPLEIERNTFSESDLGFHSPLAGPAGISAPPAVEDATAPPSAREEQDAGRIEPELAPVRFDAESTPEASSVLEQSRVTQDPSDDAPGRSSKAPRPARAKPAPRSRGEPYARAAGTRGSPAGLVAGGVLLAVVGGGSWFGWSMMSGEEPPPPARTYAVVEIPAIPLEYEPIFRQLAAGALQDVVGRMSALDSAARLPAAPPGDWLAGDYLANASRYPEVATYWNALNAHLMSLRAQEEQLFREAFQGRLASAAVATPAHDDLSARAEAGFRAALPERDRSYDRLSAARSGCTSSCSRTRTGSTTRPCPAAPCSTRHEPRPSSSETSSGARSTRSPTRSRRWGRWGASRSRRVAC